LNAARRWSDAVFYRVAFLIAVVRRRRVRVALIFPERIRPNYTIWKTCMLLGLRIEQQPATPPDVTIYWEDTTAGAPPPNAANLLNGRCTDIGKDIVEQRFGEVFGYPLAIDAATHTGPYVRKSRLNFAHDGSVRSAPLEQCEPDSVYERLVDNAIDGGWQVMDIRTPIVGTRIPIVILLYRSITDRFGTDSPRGVAVSPNSVFSQAEQTLIIALAQAMGLDFGELDILRDATDGRIYVVDVNKTPSGPPAPLSLGERHRAMRLIAEAFAAEFLEPRPIGVATSSARP
jgi:hypothetical protein